MTCVDDIVKCIDQDHSTSVNFASYFIINLSPEIYNLVNNFRFCFFSQGLVDQRGVNFNPGLVNTTQNCNCNYDY